MTHPLPLGLQLAILRTAFLRFAIAAAALHGSHALGAQSVNDHSLHWQCQQEYGNFHEVLCIALVRPTGIPGAFASRPLPTDPYWEDVLGAASTALPTAASPAFTTALGGSDLRPVAMRGPEQVHIHGGWRVPLFTRPSEQSAVVALLQKVLCGNVDCTVHYNPQRMLLVAR